MKSFILILLLTSSLSFAQEKEQIELTGELAFDSKISFDETNSFDNGNDLDFERKSPLSSALLSAAIPGAGQFYNNDYLKAALFLAVEVGAVAAAIIYNQKGDDKTEEFENYANENWSVERYARWTIQNAQNINPNVNVDNYNVFNGNNVNWDELNRLEGDIGDYYSHRLAPLGDQQYYEMIGKYPQFNPGWSEFGDDPNKPFYYGDPLTSQFLFYAGERGDANDYYDISSTSVTLVVANHILSAIEAAWTSSRINKNLGVELKMGRIKFNGRNSIHPQLNLSYSF